MTLLVTFPGGLRVDAALKGFVVHTDQPAPDGDGSAPTPFDYFLASVGTCAGFYVASFLRQRQLPLKEVALALETEKNPATQLVGKIRLTVRLPAGFPEKYRPAILRAVDQCTVKRHLAEPPAFETVLEVAGAPAGAFAPDSAPVGV
jgi:ribosomal protein S12 methylthiotransferase accessory factor